MSNTASTNGQRAYVGIVREYSRYTARGVVEIPDHPDVPFVGTCYYGLRAGSDRWPSPGQKVRVLFTGDELGRPIAHPLALLAISEGVGADGETRTLTLLRAPGLEAGASTSFATSAFDEECG